MDSQTKRRLININRFYYEQKRKKINLIIIFFVICITMIVPYTLYFSNILNKSTFLFILVFIMLFYLFYVMYELDIYDIKSVYKQEIEKIVDTTEKRFAEFINENCDCPEDL